LSSAGQSSASFARFKLAGVTRLRVGRVADAVGVKLPGARSGEADEELKFTAIARPPR
jgi:hypothetical protein